MEVVSPAINITGVVAWVCSQEMAIARFPAVSETRNALAVFWDSSGPRTKAPYGSMHRQNSAEPAVFIFDGPDISGCAISVVERMTYLSRKREARHWCPGPLDKIPKPIFCHSGGRTYGVLKKPTYSRAYHLGRRTNTEIEVATTIRKSCVHRRENRFEAVRQAFRRGWCPTRVSSCRG